MKNIFRVLIIIAGVYFLLLIPLPQNKRELQKASQIPFVWNQNKLWEALETSFKQAKEIPSKKLDSIVGGMTIEMESLLLDLQDTIHAPDDNLYRLIEDNFFLISPLIAAQQKKSDWYIQYYNGVRKKIKSDSRYWDVNNLNARITSYRMLYGMRATVEEILLQSSDNEFVSTMFVMDEPSVTPSVNILGIKVHSGDLLVSRGGAEVSAFISRGNDFPGNFSHVAMIHIDKKTNDPYFVEAHIERGVAIGTLDEYLNDKN